MADLHIAMANLLNEDTEPLQPFEIEATVTSGLEPVAAGEVEEKLAVTASHGRGSVCFPYSKELCAKVKELKSIDNYQVILLRLRDFTFPSSEAECLRIVRHLVPTLPWKAAVNIWCQFSGYEREVNCLPHVENPDIDQIVARDWTFKNPTLDPQSAERGASDVSDTNEEVGAAPISAKDEAVTEPTETEAAADSKQIPGFRVTCYRKGLAKRLPFESPTAACHFGAAIQDYLGWLVDLDNFDLEIILNLEEHGLTAGIALTKESQHRRTITHFSKTVLRPTICYSMLRLCQIKKNEVVCDPMCGGGTIPLEASINWPEARHVCGDLDLDSVTRARSNLSCVNKDRIERGLDPIDLDVREWDATNLPLGQEEIDVMVSDIPFGKRSGSVQDNRRLYPALLASMARVTRCRTGRACLLTGDKRSLTQAVGKSKLWSRLVTYSVNVGGLNCGLWILKRNKLVWDETKPHTKGQGASRDKKQLLARDSEASVDQA